LYIFSTSIFCVYICADRIRADLIVVWCEVDDILVKIEVREVGTGEEGADEVLVGFGFGEGGVEGFLLEQEKRRYKQFSWI
jgi:hypothetical protein